MAHSHVGGLYSDSVLIGGVTSGIANSEYFIAVLSPMSIKSEWVKREIDSAMIREIQEKRVRLVPVLVGSVADHEIPGDIRGKLYLDFRTEESAKAALERLIDFLKPETRLRKLFLKELRAGLPKRGDPISKLSEVGAAYHDQTIQMAAIRGLLNIGTPNAMVAIVERLYDTWGCTALKYCINGLAKMKGDVGAVALAPTIFWDDRYVVEKVSAIVQCLDDRSDIRAFVQSHSSRGRITVQSIIAAMREHTTPAVAAAFDYSCFHLPLSSDHPMQSRMQPLQSPLFSKREVNEMEKLLDKTLPGLTLLIRKKLPTFDHKRWLSSKFKMEVDPNDLSL